MTTKQIFQRFIQTTFLILWILSSGLAQKTAALKETALTEAAQKIRNKYEKNAYKLKPGKVRSYGIEIMEEL